MAEKQKKTEQQRAGTNHESFLKGKKVIETIDSDIVNQKKVQAIYVILENLLEAYLLCIVYMWCEESNHKNFE